eukprot:681016-Amphidinium_carterae.1
MTEGPSGQGSTSAVSSSCPCSQAQWKLASCTTSSIHKCPIRTTSKSSTSSTTRKTTTVDLLYLGVVYYDENKNDLEKL